MIDLRLLQIVDSAFPLGGFAFSSGLESITKLGLIRDRAAFEKYLNDHLKQVVSGDIPFVNSAFRRIGDGFDSVEPVFKVRDAFVAIPAMRKASITQGRSLLSTMRAVYSDYAFAEFADWLHRRNLLPHLAPTFGVCAGISGLPHRDALSGYCYMSLRDQITAAVRLGLLGPHDGQRALRNALAQLDAALDSALDLEYHQAFRTCYALEIAQAHHSRLYSRLFQS